MQDIKMNEGASPDSRPLPANPERAHVPNSRLHELGKRRTHLEGILEDLGSLWTPKKAEPGGISWTREMELREQRDRARDHRRYSHISSTSAASKSSRIGRRLSRPLSFGGSIWLKNPDDIVLQFDYQDEDAPESFDQPQYNWTRAKKKRMVYLISLAAMFSPLSSNIYFPALPAIAKALNTPADLVALTITIYMIFQGIAPSFWGPLADSYGRRLVLLSTLLVYLLANIILALPTNFAVLMVFRAVQAAGSASTIAIGAGIIGDIAQADERGGFMGLFGGIRMFGQAIGPVFGGALSQYLGFRSIFYFLVGLSALVIISLALFLPETMRKIAGDGSRKLWGIYRPLAGQKNLREAPPPEERYKPSALRFSMILESFKLLAEKDVAVTLMFGAIIYTVWSMITSSTASLFKEEYNLNEVLIGVAFLPNGLGCVVGSLLTGKLMDRDYKRAARLYREEHGLPENTELKQQQYPDFPIEHARLRSAYILGTVFAIATAVYGFAVEWIIFIPLSLQFLTAFTATAIFNINSTLMIDLYPARPASATAISNLMRCSVGAIGVGVVEPMISAIDEATTFCILAGLAAFSMILLWIERKHGSRWRQERLRRQLEEAASRASSETLVSSETTRPSSLHADHPR